MEDLETEASATDFYRRHWGRCDSGRSSLHRIQLRTLIRCVGNNEDCLHSQSRNRSLLGSFRGKKNPLGRPLSPT